MDKKTILLRAQEHIKETFLKESTGHDYYHIERVVINARKILLAEQADPFLVELAAWLHDLGDHKLHQGVDKSEELIGAFLQSLKVEQTVIDRIVEIVSQVSFSKGNTPTSIEAQIVQDADRLDAIGASVLPAVLHTEEARTVFYTLLATTKERTQAFNIFMISSSN